MKTARLSLILAAALAAAFLFPAGPARSESMNDPGTAFAVFSAGCFWCTESDFEKVPGVLEVISGYAGGTQPNPTYEEVSSGRTGHRESVKVVFDPKTVSYRELLDWFWQHVDPTDPGGSFVDRGGQYTSAIFFADESQRKEAEESKAALERSGIYGKPIVTAILPLAGFYPAEEYHQDYYKHHALKYKYYRWNSGRDQFLGRIWGEGGEREGKLEKLRKERER